MPDQSLTSLPNDPESVPRAGGGEEDFSLVLGGPLFQIFRRTHLSGSALELLHRRIFVFIVITWLPLLVLSLWEGLAWGNKVILPFLRDIEVHARFLVALPLLLIAEPIVHKRLPLELVQFSNRKLIPDHARTQFDNAVASATRLRNSVLAEVLILGIVYGVGVLFVWRRFIEVDVSNWRGSGSDAILDPTMAGWWFGLVSLPFFQFLLLRWYYRLLIWARFLWQVSRIELRLLATHPDRRAGLGFLANVTHAFLPLLVAQGVLLAGMAATQVLVGGRALADMKFDIVGIVAWALFFVLGPLLFFSPQMAEARRLGRRGYGVLAQQYVSDFDHKWLDRGEVTSEGLIGSADIQSLADMGNSYQVINEMKLWPFNAATILQLAIAILLPVAPLLLTVVSLDELLTKVLRIVF